MIDADATKETVTLQQLLESEGRLPLVTPFVSGTPVILPDGSAGTVESNELVLTSPEGRQRVASYWPEARTHVKRGAVLAADSMLKVRTGAEVRAFHAGELRIVVRKDLLSSKS